MEWTHFPGDAISAPLTHSGPYVFSHRPEGVCGSYRPTGEHHSLRWFTDVEQAKEAAERHAKGARCTCGMWTRLHDADCPLIKKS